LVNIVEDWEEMEQYASRASYATARAYQREKANNKTCIRVLVGKFGFEKEFPNEEDTLFARIKSFCDAGSFLNVGKTVPDDQFFK
jgi:hypothetical protein